MRTRLSPQPRPARRNAETVALVRFKSSLTQFGRAGMEVEKRGPAKDCLSAGPLPAVEASCAPGWSNQRAGVQM